MKDETVYLTKPNLPPLEELIPYLKRIWKTRQLTNEGPFQEEFEDTLCKFLGVKHISVVSSATTALMLALKALGVKGEVITTPFSFVATSHAITWNALKPVFCDINKNDFTLNTDLIPALITKNTAAILPVHIFGYPCNVGKIETIAKQYNLKVLYDASHCFGVKLMGQSIFNFGDLSVVSFHATKVFNTFEGGAVISHTREMKEKIDRLRSFGYIDEEHIQGIGLNGKMNEFQSVIGLVQLKYFKGLINKRKVVSDYYKENLKSIEGISVPEANMDYIHNFAFFPIIVTERYPLSRDELYELLKSKGIHARKYFYPLISNLADYNTLQSANRNLLSNANSIANKILCLPIYPDLQFRLVEKISKIMKEGLS